MPIVVDASVIIAVIANEPVKSTLIALTRGEELVSPHSLPWEIINAFSAMFKRKAIELPLASMAVDEFLRIPIRFVDSICSDRWNYRIRSRSMRMMPT